MTEGRAGKMRDWTTQELADKANLKPSRIRQLLICGDIKGEKRAGAWFIPDAEAKRWLDLRNNTR